MLLIPAMANIQSSGDAFRDVLLAMVLVFLMGGYFVVLLILLMVGIAASHAASRGFGMAALGLYLSPVIGLAIPAITDLGRSVSENLVLFVVGALWFFAFTVNSFGLLKFVKASGRSG